MAAMNVDTAGDPKVACQKFSKSATESKWTVAHAELSDTAWALLSAAAVDSDLRSTINKPVRTLEHWLVMLVESRHKI